MTAIPISRSFGTHNGTFHADEVTACALLIVHDLVDQDKVQRTRDPKVHASCEFVCDVGGIYDSSRKLFDHHQADYQGTLSSAGMIMNYLEETNRVATQEAKYFRRNLLDGVDAHDIGQAPLIEGLCSFSNVISQFTPVSYTASANEQNIAFHEAVSFTVSMLTRMRERYLYLASCKSIVADAMKGGDACLFFDKSLPWLEPFFELGGENHPASFVLMPAGEHWKLRCIPPNYKERMGVRHPLPQAWAGLLENDLKAVCGIPGAIFCHKGRFISVWETLEDARAALKMIQELDRA